MKDKNKILIIFLIIILPLLIILNVSPKNSKNDDVVIDELNQQIINKKELKKPKASGFWNVDFIHIKSDNWSATDLPWIQNHTGTYQDPHIIENVTISLTNWIPASGIFIEDCAQHFIIRNCTLFNCSGLELENATNSIIFNNNISSTSGTGIYLLGCDNITIANNIVNGTGLDGIQMDFCSNCTISGNKASFNDRHGFRTFWGFNHSFYGNIALNNSNGGYSLTQLIESKIFKNIIINNQVYGISLRLASENTTVYNNVFIGNKIHNGDCTMNGPNIKWDNGIIGNYWDNYTEIGGIDNNNDGIGDVYYPLIQLGVNVGNDTKPIYANPIHQGERIHIDDSGGSALNWSQTELVKWWCEGSGIESDPYVIRDLTINGGGSGSCILIENSNVYFTIENCTVFNCEYNMLDYAGIKLLNTNHSIIKNNTCSDNQGIGIILYDNCNNNTIIANTVNDNGACGIFFDEGCHDNLIIGNTVNDNTETGIRLGSFSTGFENNNNNTISNNIVLNNFYGGILTGGLYNNFTGNFLYHNTFGGPTMVALEDYGNYTIISENVMVENKISLSGWYSILHNNTFIKTSLGFFYVGSKEQVSSYTISDTNTVNDGILYYYANEIGLTKANFTGKIGQIIIANCNNSLLSELSFSNGSSLSLYYSCYNSINNANFTENSNIGISATSHHNVVSNCILKDCSHFGALLNVGGKNNTIIDCEIINSSMYGIYLYGELNYFIGNTIIDNSIGIQGEGVWVNNNKFIDNHFVNNGYGIWIWPYAPLGSPSYNNITNNVFENNNKGIYLFDCDYTTVKDNVIINCNNIGIDLFSSGGFQDISEYNTFYRNFFRKNRYDAVDNNVGISNNWDSGLIGNYWDNYTGIDSDGDGIGDSAHSFDGIVDNYPIYDKFAPYIEIISPQENEGINRTAPDYLVYIYENYTFRMWYTIDGGVNNITFTQNGTIDQSIWETLWDSLSTGDNITIRFYAEDKPGHIGMAEINVSKFDILTVKIIEPSAGTYGPASLLIRTSITNVAQAVAMINASPPFNISLTKSGSYWICYWDNISLYTSGDYNITIWAIDIHGYVNDTEYVVITIDIGGAPSLPAGDDDDDDGDGKDEFDIVEFLTSPIGLTIIGGSIAAVAIIIIIKIKGSGKSRVKEIERIERLGSE